MQKPPNKQPTTKQQEILYLFYRFRYLNTHHIQQFLHHKNPTRIQIWLKILTDDGYLHSFYDPTTVQGRATPAVYCLTTKAGHVLHNNKVCDKKLLTYLYKEKKRSVRFRNHCLFLVDIYFLLLEHYNNVNVRVHFSTKVDLVGYSHFPHPLPDAYIALIKRGTKRQRYFLTIIDPSTPWFVINARVQQYLTYFEEGTWQDHTNVENPILLFVCWDTKSVRYLKKAIKTAQEGYYEIAVPFYFITRETLLKHGFTNNVWQQLSSSN